MRLLLTTCLGIGILAIVVSFQFEEIRRALKSVGLLPQFDKQSREDSNRVKVFTKEELAEYDGTDVSKPLLLVVLGEVFDVTSGSRFYAKGNEYNIFLAKDSSRAFHDGKFNRSVEDVRDLNVMAVRDVTGWRAFFRKHETYRFVGVLDGLYFDSEGTPLPALRDVERMEQEGKDAQTHEDQVMKRFSSCSMKHDGITKITEMWCDPSAQGETRYPRLFTWNHVGTGLEAKRCVCVTKADVEGTAADIPKGQLTQYHGDCGNWVTRCTIKVG